MASDHPAVQLLRLVKIFNTLDYAESFMRGGLHMKTVRYFRDHHDEADLQRGDSLEGVAAVFQPARIGMLRLGDIEIARDTLASPILVHSQASLSRNLFCMYALTNRGWPPTVSAEKLKDLQATLEVHSSCFDMGGEVVLIENPREFLSRIQKAIREKNFRATGNLVEYFDGDSHHGGFDPERAPFMKRVKYAHQKEWRLVLDRQHHANDTYTLDIGDIGDITRLTTPEGLRKLLELRLPDENPA